MEQKYQCKLCSANSINITFSGIYANIDKYFVDENYGNLFIVLLDEVINDFKYKGILYVTQNITKDDWELFLKDKTSWKIYGDTNDIVQIICELNELKKNLCIGFDLL
jgi:hypothetical protein